MSASVSYPPGPAGRPIVGSLRAFQRDRLGFLLSVADQYGDLAHMRFGPRHVYLVNRPDDVRAVLVEQADAFTKTPLFKKSTRRVIGDGLLTSEDPLHRRQRRMMQGAFHHQRISGYADTMVSLSSRLADDWHGGDSLDIHAAMTRLTMQIVTATLFGADVTADAPDIHRAITGGLERTMRRSSTLIGTMPEWLPTPGNLRARRDLEVLDRVVMGMINERRASREDRGDLLSMLLLARDEEDTERGMSDQQVRDEAMTLFIAGHETTANALAWTFYLLAQHPAAAATLRAELDAVLGGRAPVATDLPALLYTEMVVKESMRLFPPAWIIPRYAVAPVTISGYAVTPGSTVLISPYVLHHTGRYFADPERFMPERFAGAVEESIPRYAYLPFGAGPRVCIGNSFAMMEARLVLATLLQRYELELLPGQSVTPRPLVTLRPRTGIQMSLRARQRLLAVA